jgi:RNA polymerase sigma-70 factor, ECF subfamily
MSDGTDEIKITESQINDNPEPINELLRQDFWKQIGLILDKLPRMEKEVFLLRFLDHLSIKEISSALEKSESTVKTHLYRALVKFRNNSSTLQILKE